MYYNYFIKQYNMYYIDLYYLNNCPYSERAKMLLDLKNVKYNIIKIDQSDKEKYKNNEINTFPQIYLKKENSKGSVLLGGFSDINLIYNSISDQLDSSVNSIRKINKNLSKKASLRLIELFTKN